MALSGSFDYLTTRDDIIKRALRIIGALGQGETPPTAAVTEAAQTLNELTKEWQADGMQLWKYVNTTMTPVAGTASYNVGVGATVNTAAPWKILKAFRRIGTTTAQNDVPLALLTQDEYLDIPNKNIAGTPINLWYKTPTTDGFVGSITLWPVPDAAFVTTNSGKIGFSYLKPMDDFDASSNNPDIPSYYANALAWGLADQLSYEYGLGPVDKAQINKKATFHKATAMSFDQEEGSLFIYPNFEGKGS